MPKRSAGILPYRRKPDGIEVLLVHPGGPFWRHRDAGAWQIAKGEVEPGEDAETTARREAAEELGVAIDAELSPLGEIRQAGGKLVEAFACEMDVDAAAIVSAMVEIEWPRGSGRRIAVPEIDAARWLPLAEARRMMLPSQEPLLGMLEHALGTASPNLPARPGCE